MIKTHPITRLATAATLALAAAGCAESDPEGPAPWDGTLREGVLTMQERAEAGEFNGALGVADQILAPDRLALFRQRLGLWTNGASESALRPVTKALDWVGIDALQDADRAEVEYARGQVELLRGQTEEDASAGYEAERCMERARAAGGSVRPDALTVLGTIQLLRAEEARATIPEIAQANGAGQGALPGQPPMLPPTSAGTPPAQAAGADAEEEEDPIETARTLYRMARTPLIERLQFHLEGDDPKSETLATTRAHLELCTRRLRELDEIEQQREEDQQNEDQENEDKQDGDGEPEDDKSDKNEDGEPKDGEPQDGEPGDQEPEQDPSEQEAEEPSEQDPATDEEPQSEAPIEEKNLTEEELARFLEQAREDREEGEDRRRQLLRKRKTETQRDW